MNKRIRLLLKNWLPPIIHEKLCGYRAWLKFLMYEKKRVLKKNSVFENTARGKRAFLIATGPSLKMDDLSALAGEDCYGISNFFLHEHIQSVNPKFHFFVPYHAPVTIESYLEWLMEADKSLPPETNIFMGHSAYELVNKFNLFRGRKIFYLYMSGYHAGDGVDITKPVLAPQTGPIMALPVLLYMGYSEIYLLGCDHTVMRDYKKTVQNFYDPSLDIRRTIPAGKTTGYDVWYDGIVSNLSNTLGVFEQYVLFKKIFLDRNVRIINLSQDSWLDLFEIDTLKNVVDKIPRKSDDKAL
ncbi:MAG: hypothetical protein O3B43_04030 [Chloroflexi bacterium]|nr:hypothetical protein [Chloroflexota bacterium]